MGNFSKRFSWVPATSYGRNSTATGLKPAHCHRLLFEPLEPRLLLASGPLITEFMADTTATDANGDDSDWIEIHNPTDQTIELEDWYLSDKTGELDKWQFPDNPGIDTTLSPGEYMLVYASGKSDGVYPYVDTSGYLHTNFKLSADGENVLLVEDDGATPPRPSRWGTAPPRSATWATSPCG